MKNKLALISAIILSLGALWWLGFDKYLTFDYIKSHHDYFLNYYQQNKLLTIVSYFIFYVFVTALSIPAANILTLLGGAIFGFVGALIIISFASTIGATLAFLLSRTLFRDWVKKRLGKRFDQINQGIEKDGAFYLFSLRLIPVVPFFFINLSMGLTKMPIGKYFIVSQIAMLPGTVLYVNAGLQLSQLSSLEDVLSINIALSLAAMGLFPIIAKFLLKKL